MAGILILICVYAILGFMLAWIAGMVAQEEVEMKTGVIVLVLSGILSTVASLALKSAMPDLAPWPGVLAQYAILMTLLNLVAKLSWKHSAIIALIYTVVIFGAMFGIGMCVGAMAN